jgi:hypothetical protein
MTGDGLGWQIRAQLDQVHRQIPLCWSSQLARNVSLRSCVSGHVFFLFMCTLMKFQAAMLGRSRLGSGPCVPVLLLLSICTTAVVSEGEFVTFQAAMLSGYRHHQPCWPCRGGAAVFLGLQQFAVASAFQWHPLRW